MKNIFITAVAGFGTYLAITIAGYLFSKIFTLFGAVVDVNTFVLGGIICATLITLNLIMAVINKI